MKNLKYKEANLSERTEHVQHIIERMPANFGIFVTIIIIFVFILLLVFGWIIRYPDVVSGQIVINSNTSPVRLVAGGNGKIKLTNLKTSENVKEGQVLAYIENPTTPENIYFITDLLKKLSPSLVNIIDVREMLPQNFSLGELNGKYHALINSLDELINYRNGKLLSKQATILLTTLVEQENAIIVARRRLDGGINSLKYAHKFYSRDSLLFLQKVISESELDRSALSYNTSKDNYESYLNNLIIARQEWLSTKSKIQEIQIQNPKKKTDLEENVISAYNDFLDNVKLWELKYVFKAPFSGSVQFLKFWNNNQFIQVGEQIFTVIPKKTVIIGQVSLPSKGSGKVKVGQEVIVKLDDFPFNEYGAVTGIVRSISLSSNTIKTDKGDIENYLVNIVFPHGLKTNYGSRLNFKIETKGTAEIIVNDRMLIERLFDNLKYITR